MSTFLCPPRRMTWLKKRPSNISIQGPDYMWSMATLAGTLYIGSRWEFIAPGPTTPCLCETCWSSQQKKNLNRISMTGQTTTFWMPAKWQPVTRSPEWHPRPALPSIWAKSEWQFWALSMLVKWKKEFSALLTISTPKKASLLCILLPTKARMAMLPCYSACLALEKPLYQQTRTDSWLATTSTAGPMTESSTLKAGATPSASDFPRRKSRRFSTQ